MPYYDRCPYPCRWNWSLRQPIVTGVLSALMVVSGMVPTLRWSSHPTLQFRQVAIAQTSDIDRDELRRYGASILVIEPMRQAAYDEIKRILGDNDVPSIACHRPNSLNSLPRNIRQIAVNYCNRSIEIVEQNGLTITRFNEITTLVHRDPALEALVQQVIIQIQNR